MWLYNVTGVVRPLFRWYWSMRLVGAEKVPSTGPLLVAANHASYGDPWFLGVLFPRWPIRYLINGEWFVRSPVWNFVFRSYGVIVAADGKPHETIRRAVEALDGGSIVGVFPEGRISSDGRLGRGRSGIARMAAASGVPVVPCGLRGPHETLPRRARWPKRAPVHLHIGDPLLFPGSPTPSPDPAAIAGFVERLMDEIARLSGASVRERVEGCEPDLELESC